MMGYAVFVKKGENHFLRFWVKSISQKLVPMKTLLECCYLARFAVYFGKLYK